MSYQLQTNKIGRTRLNLQAKLYNPGSYQFLDAHNIKKGQSILEIGCGSGSMTPRLAELVGKNGRVLAIDNSCSQVLATHRVIKKLSLTQVECRELSVFDLDQLHETFDIIYIRLVLIHLQSPDAALLKIAQRLRKSGRLIVEEFLNSCNFSNPNNLAFNKRRHVIEQFYIKNKLDPNFGLTLKSKLQKLKLLDIQESLFQPILKNKNKNKNKNKSERKLLTLFLYENKDKFIDLKILTAGQWRTLIKDLEKIEINMQFFVALTSMYQISAKKS